ncbi:SWI/SNF-related matrix-associated actin-dependent regulator of chromatin subfamily D [Nematocida sp. AWRm77]|nr:SWI/SNF-related matrix-associated actin-dependent regulator of chromatin subfamily D [Nematocida sp. AWRm77]
MSRSERLYTLFESLMVIEKRLNKEVAKKKMAVEEAHFKKIKHPSTIRINVMMERSAEGALFMLIGGKIRKEVSSAEKEGQSGEAQAETRPISSAISKLYVDLSQPQTDLFQASAECLKIEETSERLPRGSFVALESASPSFFEWNNTECEGRISEFEIKTLHSTDRATLYLGLISYTGTYTVCKDLAEVIGVKAGSKSVILLGVWKYIIAQKMRDPKKPKAIVCNSVFKRVFKAEEITFKDLIERLDMYITPVEMIKMDFAVPNTPGSKAQVAYDITVELDSDTKEYAYFNEAKISILDKKISDILVRIDKQNEKIKSLQSFVADPKEFITTWILESSKNLHLVSDDLYEVNDGFFMQKEIQESVYQLLQNYK